VETNGGSTRRRLAARGASPAHCVGVVVPFQAAADETGPAPTLLNQVGHRLASPLIVPTRRRARTRATHVTVMLAGVADRARRQPVALVASHAPSLAGHGWRLRVSSAPLATAGVPKAAPVIRTSPPARAWPPVARPVGLRLRSPTPDRLRRVRDPHGGSGRHRHRTPSTAAPRTASTTTRSRPLAPSSGRSSSRPNSTR
jgi:hypothetical protein